MLDGGRTSDENDDDRWNNATGEVANLLEPLGETGAGRSQDSQRKVSPFPRAPIDSSDRQATIGIALYALCTLCSSGMSIFAKLAGQHGVPVFEIVLVRSAIVAAFAAAKLAYDDAAGEPLLGHRRWLLLVRGMCGFGAGSCLYGAVNLLPLGDALVLTSFTPLLVAVLSPVLIGELPSRAVLGGVPFCIAAVFLVARPSFLFGGVGLRPKGVVVAALQTVFSGLVKLLVRELRTTERTNVIVLYLGSVSTLGAAVACTILPGGFVLPTKTLQLYYLLGAGLSGYASQVTMTMALRRAKAAPATAMSYLSVIWGMIAGEVLFHERPTLLSMLGAVIICCSTIGVTLYETHATQQGRQAAFETELGSASDRLGKRPSSGF